MDVPAEILAVTFIVISKFHIKKTCNMVLIAGFPLKINADRSIESKHIFKSKLQSRSFFRLYH
jgi:hypothetical protein